MFEVFDHTADLVFASRAADLSTLFEEAGRAFLSVVVSNPDVVEPRFALEVHVAGTDREYLFLDWIDELLYRFESKKFLASQFDVIISDDGVRGTIRGEPYDSARHLLAHEVKAVTYHGLKVEPIEGGWLAEVILDI